VPVPPREPLAPMVNPFSDSEAPVTAELVPTNASTSPVAAQPQDPFGGKATVSGSASGHRQPQVAATYAQPHGYAQPEPAQYAKGFGESRQKSNTLLYIFGALMFCMVGFALLIGIGVYQIVNEINGLSFDGAQALAIQDEDYETARSQFETKLVSRGAAPQAWDELETPRGAAELFYESDGHTLLAFISQPTTDGEPRPGVVFLHGGFAWGDSDWDMSQPYRDRGFVVMTPVLRGENGQSGHFSFYYDEVDDVLAATSAFAALPYVDETELYIAGHSAGGTLAALTVMTSDRFLAMASYSGSMNQDGAGIWDPDYLVYDESDKREMLMRSPEAYAKSFKCPAQLYYGSEEYWLRTECERTAATARLAGHRVVAHRVPGDHFSSVLPAMLRSINFFEQQGRAGDTRIRISRVAAPSGLLRDRIPHREMPTVPAIPVVPELTIPELPPRPEAPTIRHADFSTRQERPSFRTASTSAIHQGTLTIEVTGYSGRFIESVDARRALIRCRWADHGRIEFDKEAGVIRVPVRKHFELNTEAAKEYLEKVGFETGAITFKPIGTVDESKVAE